MKKITMTRIAKDNTKVTCDGMRTYYPDGGDPEGYMRGVGSDYEVLGQQEAYDAMLIDSRNWAEGESQTLVCKSKSDIAQTPAVDMTGHDELVAEMDRSDSDY